MCARCAATHRRYVRNQDGAKGKVTDEMGAAETASGGETESRFDTRLHADAAQGRGTA